MIANLVREETTTTGTGDLTLSAVLRRFSTVFGTGATNVFSYLVFDDDAGEYEAGIGYMSDANTLVRRTVIESSNSDALVSFSSGTKKVVCQESEAFVRKGADEPRPTGLADDLEFLRDGATSLSSGYTDHNLASTSSTYLEKDGWGRLTMPAVGVPGGHAHRYAVRNIPSFSEIRFRCRNVTPWSAGAPYGGIYFREAGGKLTTFGPENTNFVTVGNWSNDTTFSSFPYRAQQKREDAEWFRITVNSATDWDFWIGDGYIWSKVLAAHNMQTWFGGAPTEVGFGMSPAIGTAYVTCGIAFNCIRFTP